MGLAERLKQARLDAGLSQAELSKLAGVSQPAISGLETGEYSQSKHISLIAKALGVDTDWLATGSQPSQVEQGTLSARETRLLKKFRLLSESDRKVIERVLSGLKTLD